jgi:hypothetical protein
MRMVAREEESRFKENVRVCADWTTITQEFNSLPKPIWRRDEEGEAFHEGWIFRGHKRETYRLEPSIERAYPYIGWDEAEYKIVQEFKSKARMHMDPAQIPHSEDKLGWLAVIQHYGAPTRLLDFSYSPYVALYFALRDREKNESEFVEVWGIDEAALRAQADKTSWEAEKTVRAKRGEPSKSHRVSSLPEDCVSSLQQAQEEDERWSTSVRHALAPDGVRREHFNRNGFVAVASPTLHNPRLSSQQGLFLFNGAESRLFELSLEDMMQDVKQLWYRRFRVPEGALEEIEKQLFQLNIHELSLFPDIAGLAGFVRQKIRLHW